MKKSKIILPALGVLLLSTVASVSGSVAWFTATRTFSMTASQFGVTKLDGDLACTLGDGVGTTASGATVTVNGLMADTSVNASGKIWTNDGDVTDKFKEITTVGSETDELLTAGTDSSSNTIWWAVTWTMTFQYTFAGSTKSQDIFFNPSTSTATGTKRVDGTGTDPKQSYKGFRIGFFDGATCKAIWAPNQTTDNCNSVTSTTATSATSNLLASDTDDYKSGDYTEAADGGSNTSRKDYLGSIAYNATPANCKKTIKCIAWFEGTDPTVINTARLDYVAASLNFYARTAA